MRYTDDSLYPEKMSPLIIGGLLIFCGIKLRWFRRPHLNGPRRSSFYDRVEIS
jgi:hypothetical protein